MKRVTSVLRRFHLIKEPPESDTRQRLKKELFACNSVSCIFSLFFQTFSSLFANNCFSNHRLNLLYL